MGCVPRGKEVVIIGDTPADMTCGKGIGARAIGVATGPFGVADLEAAGGFAVFEDLSMTDMVMTAIFA
jgi:phosphoglycolate phosphatase